MQTAWQARAVNRLADETSPYLLQHADNPVDWYPWGEEALGRARDEDRPILLSIGYAACHWCHVMEHESFEDASTAAVMNEHFVSVKVDREERPDLDAVYMEAVVALSGHGGWPMTVFLTPAGEPFFGGTYYPPEPRHGMPSFRQVLDAIAEAWRDRRDDVARAAAQLVEAVRHSAELRPSNDPLTDSVLSAAERNLAATFEPAYGGWGRAPKFPNAPALEFLLRRDERRGARDGGEDARRDGGRRDVRPARRRLPPLLGRRPLARAALREDALRQRAARARRTCTAGSSPATDRYREIASETVEYMLRELLLPEGGLASAQDADTDGVEGLTFTWTEEEGAPAELLEPFEHGRSIIRGDVDEATRARLLAIREQRPKPLRDDKAIASWNGLALAALAEAGRRLDRPDWIEAARRLGEFLLGPLSATGRPAAAQLPRRAARAARATSTTTRTSPTGCSSCTSRRASCAGCGRRTGSRGSRSSSSPTRSAAASSSRPPTASSWSRGRRSSTTTRSRPATRCSRTCCSGSRGSTATTSSSGRASRCSGCCARRSSGCRRRSAGGSCALDLHLSPPHELAIVGPVGSEVARAALEPWQPRAVVAVGPADDVPLLAGKDLVGGQPAVYVCERFACRAPVTDPALI